jgi:hypothetical protein
MSARQHFECIYKVRLCSIQPSPFLIAATDNLHNQSYKQTASNHPVEL